MYASQNGLVSRPIGTTNLRGKDKLTRPYIQRLYGFTVTVRGCHQTMVDSRTRIEKLSMGSRKVRIARADEVDIFLGQEPGTGTSTIDYGKARSCIER